MFVTQCYVAYCYLILSARVGISGVLLLSSIATLVSGVGSRVLICLTHSTAATAVTRKWAQLCKSGVVWVTFCEERSIFIE